MRAKRARSTSGDRMHLTLKVVSFVVLGLMGVALGYAAYISISNWNGIGV